MDQHNVLLICVLLCDSQTRRYMYAEPLKISATCSAFVLLLLIQMSIMMYYTYWLHNPLDWLPRIAVLLTVQRFEIPSQDLGTEHSVCFPFGDDAHAAWEACKRRAGWQPSLHQQQSHVAAALQGPLLRNPHSRNADAPPSDTIALTPAAVAEAAAASGARLTKAAAASGARQPAAPGSQRRKTKNC